MKDLRLTSPGLMLIIGVVLAAGIFLLDLFYLNPLVNSHRQAALKEQALQMEQDTRLLVQSAQNSLSSSCQTWSQTRQAKSLLSSGGPQPCQSLVEQVVQARKGKVAWLCDAQGNILATCFNDTGAGQPLPKSLPQAVQALSLDAKTPTAGLVRIDNSLMLFAQAPIGTDAASGLKTLGLAKRLSESTLAGGAPARIDLDFIPADSLPTASNSTATCVWQLASDANGLFVDWLVSDPNGKTLGYFQAQAPVSQAYSQSVTARRVVLIILSLSVGLVLLIIMGVHMLVAGPVIRLLKKIQEIESGKGGAAELTQHMHGEPLVLARRLESVFERLAHQSKTDQLTGIANRRHFEEVLACFYQQARRYNRPLSLVIMDVDNFKIANDTGGHPYGDQVLQMVTREIEACCRKADLPARWGGDEFAILMPETSCTDAGLVAERIRHAITARSLKDPAGLRISLSVGIADLNSGEIDSPQAVINLADRALYAAKEMGRDRLVQAHELNGLTWPGSCESTGHVNLLRNKVAGLDNQVRDFFLRAVEEMLTLLRDRDPYMADQATRVRRLASLLGEEMGLPIRVLRRLEMAAMLHDIGMISMPDSILLNTGPLNEQQLQIMHRHPLLSVRIMEGVQFLDQEIPSVRHHHERYDGNGYPEGLKGDEIPLTARIIAVADAFVSMTSPRCFRAAKTLPQTLDEIRSASGSQFDPAVVEALLSLNAKAPQEFNQPQEAAHSQESSASAP
jgi:diguanylate cyclase (GGDEF)-like protein